MLQWALSPKIQNIFQYSYHAPFSGQSSSGPNKRDTAGYSREVSGKY
jgi:hypothetical protein